LNKNKSLANWNYQYKESYQEQQQCLQHICGLQEQLSQDLNHDPQMDSTLASQAALKAKDQNQASNASDSILYDPRKQSWISLDTW